jgi:hypothetical protein
MRVQRARGQLPGPAHVESEEGVRGKEQSAARGRVPMRGGGEAKRAARLSISEREEQ